jgi:hypothetical protein
MKNFGTKILLFALVLLLTACASSGPTITSETRAGVDISKYKTYGWFSPLATDNAGYSSIISSNFKAAIQNEMSARGYVYDANSPQLLININATSQERADVSSTPSMSVGYYGYRGGFGYGMGMPIYGADVQTTYYKVGTVTIDVVDAQQKELIWTGTLEGVLNKKAMENPSAAIQSAVNQIFAKYPIPSMAAPAPTTK